MVERFDKNKKNIMELDDEFDVKDIKTVSKKNTKKNENINTNNSYQKPTTNQFLGKKLKKIKEKDEDNLEDIIKDPGKLSNSIKNLNVNDASESSSYIEEESDGDEEVYYESDDDKSDDYEEQEYTKIKNKNNKGKKVEDSVDVWDEQKDKVKKDEELIFDNSAYEMLHRSSTIWPCFSVDWLLPEFFVPQPIKNFYSPVSPTIYPDEFPYTSYFVGGTQTNEKNGYLYYMKWFNMHRTLYDEDPDKEADSESEGGEPLMEHSQITAKGNVNRVKAMRNSYIVAYWSDAKSVELVDLRYNIEDMENRWKEDDETNKINSKKNNKKKKVEEKNSHVKSFKKRDEGFALDWSPFLYGVFASGGYDEIIDIHVPTDELCSDYTSSTTNIYGLKNSFKSHKRGVEDITWSPSNPNVLISGGIDKAIRVWDIRVNNNSSDKSSACENAHSSDINCLAWKLSCGVEMIATGSDDSTIKVWDPRFLSDNKNSIAHIQYHKGPITALSWDPLNPCQLAATSEDNRLSIWDLSVEPDEVKLKDVSCNKDVPDQLVFLHQGQENLKDVKFHPYYSDFLLSTAENGLNVFKPNFNGEENEEDEDEFTFNNNKK